MLEIEKISSCAIVLLIAAFYANADVNKTTSTILRTAVITGMMFLKKPTSSIQSRINRDTAKAKQKKSPTIFCSTSTATAAGRKITICGRY
ncbi:MAG: hypothetical protein LLF92_07950 [Planctomycetaceae bacterium]|nr:hypothetical protein [Planctomycetaceae bacterium]